MKAKARKMAVQPRVVENDKSDSENDKQKSDVNHISKSDKEQNNVEKELPKTTSRKRKAEIKEIVEPNKKLKTPSARLQMSVKEDLEEDKSGQAMPKKGVRNSPVKKAARENKTANPVLVHSLCTTKGWVLCMGQGDTGQLGLGPDVSEKGVPSAPELPQNIIQVCAGGMHSLCLNGDGEIFSFGCNDEATLGRKTEDEDECFVPAKVEGIATKIVQVCAGDSHSVALDNQGAVYTWGTFRDMNGEIGMNAADQVEADSNGKLSVKKGSSFNKIVEPVMVLSDVKIVKIASGSSHVLCLSETGQVFSFGACDFGQLGRVGRYNCEKGGRRGVGKLLTPEAVILPRKKGRCVDVWAGGYVSYAKMATGHIFCWGLNNYFQLGFEDMTLRYVPEMTPAFDPGVDWKDISIAEHHIMALDANGKLHVMGRGTYGRLGLGAANTTDIKKLVLLEKLGDKKVVSIGSNLAVSFAVDDEGLMYSWGMGSNLQLGNGSNEDDVFEPTPFAAKKLSGSKGIMVSAGGQHTLLLVQKKEGVE